MNQSQSKGGRTSPGNQDRILSATSVWLSFVDSNLQYPQDTDAKLPELKETTLTAWRNDQALAQFLIKTGSRALENLCVEVSDLFNGDDRIGKDQINCHFVKASQAYTGMLGFGDPNRPLPIGDRKEVREVLYQTSPLDLEAQSLQPVWLRIAVPAFAKPGIYQGEIRVLADHLETCPTLTYSLEVVDAVLPNASDFKAGFDIELWQNPFAVAEYYGVEPFSDRHFEILRPHMETYKSLGGHAITTTIIEEAWAGQTYSKNPVKFPSMVDWVKKIDGTFRFDYSQFDKWVSFNQSLGLGDKIVAYSIAPWTNAFRYFDEASQTKKEEAYTVGSQSYTETLTTFLQDFIRHAERKGWKDQIFIGIDERGFDQRAFDLIDSVLGIDGKPFKTAGAMDGFIHQPDLARRVTDLNVGANAVKNHPAEFEILRQDRAKAGLKTTIYTATGDKPGSYSLSAPGESYWTMLYAHAVGGQGFLRWAYDSWVENPLEDSTHNAFEAGDTFLIFPDERTATNPVSKSSLRLEKMAEGVRDVNKLLIMRKEVPALGEKIDGLLASIKPTYPSSDYYLTEEGKLSLAQDMASIKERIHGLSQEYLRLKESGSREVESLEIQDRVTSLQLGETSQLRALLQPDNLLDPRVTWTSSNPTIASVSEQGVLTGLKPGRVTIRASSQVDPSKFDQLYCQIEGVGTQAFGLYLDQESLDLYLGDSRFVTVNVVSDESDKSLRYKICHPHIAQVDDTGLVTGLAKGETSLIVEHPATGYRQEVPVKVSKSLKIQHGLPVYHLPGANLSDIEKSPGTDRQYLGQPDMIMLDDHETLITAYPIGHGHGPLVMKISHDSGESWTEKTDIPASWAGSFETPILYKLNLTDGTCKLILITGMPNWHGNQNGGWQTSLSEDQGKTWSEYRLFYPTKENGEKNWSVVAMSSLVQLKDSSGHWIDKWMGIYHDYRYVNYRTYLTFDEAGQEQWSEPEPLIPEHREIEELYQICELGVFRSPDGKRLVALGRSQSHLHKSVMFYSDDEGLTWTRPEDMQGALQGERHKMAYDPISGRLLVTFREIILDYNGDGQIDPDDWMAGDWVAWVGTYEDIMEQNEGQYRILLAEDWANNAKSGDTGYAGIVVKPDGTFILNSYGHWDKDFSLNWAEGVTTDLCYIKQAKFTLAQVDEALELG